MLLSIVLIKYKYFNFAQGSKILTYCYTIKKIYLITMSLIVKVGIVLLTSYVCISVTNLWLVKSTSEVFFVENPPGVYKLPFVFYFRSWRNTCLRFLDCSVILRLAFNSRKLFSFRSPAITFGPCFTFNDSKNYFLPCAPSFHLIRKQK